MQDEIQTPPIMSPPNSPPNSPNAPRKKRVLEQNNLKVLVMLVDIYGSTEDYSGYYTDRSNLSSSDIELLQRSIPDNREGTILDFENSSIWTFVNEKDFPEFTLNNHCQLVIAYENE